MKSSPPNVTVICWFASCWVIPSGPRRGSGEVSLGTQGSEVSGGKSTLTEQPQEMVQRILTSQLSWGRGKKRKQDTVFSR